MKRYLTTGYQGTVLQAHFVNGDHVQHYELFGAEKGQVARRTGWLDREIDWESSPLTDLYRTVDLVNRKYDPQRGVFLTSDPLWMMSADASSYHYAYHDPMNMIDPWGLDGQKGVGGPPKGDGPGPGVGPSNPSTKEITPFDHSFSFWMDGARGDYLHGIGEGALPGMSIGGGGLGPVGGSNGGTGKTDPLASSSEKWAGVPYQAGVTKFDAARNLYFGRDPVIERATKPMVITASRVSVYEHLLNDLSLLGRVFFHYQFGRMKSLDLDHTKVAFRAAKQSDLKVDEYGTLQNVPKNQPVVVDFLQAGPSALGLILGQTTVTRVGDELFVFESAPFDFEWHRNGSWLRNGLTMLGGAVVNNLIRVSPLYPMWQIPMYFGGPFRVGFSDVIVIRR